MTVSAVMPPRPLPMSMTIQADGHPAGDQRAAAARVRGSAVDGEQQEQRTAPELVGSASIGIASAATEIASIRPSSGSGSRARCAAATPRATAATAVIDDSLPFRPFGLRDLEEGEWR